MLIEIKVKIELFEVMRNDGNEAVGDEKLLINSSRRVKDCWGLVSANLPTLQHR